jgi:hypothetical protein
MCFDIVCIVIQPPAPRVSFSDGELPGDGSDDPLTRSDLRTPTGAAAAATPHATFASIKAPVASPSPHRSVALPPSPSWPSPSGSGFVPHSASPLTVSLPPSHKSAINNQSTVAGLATGAVASTGSAAGEATGALAAWRARLGRMASGHETNLISSLARSLH